MVESISISIVMVEKLRSAYSPDIWYILHKIVKYVKIIIKSKANLLNWLDDLPSMFTLSSARPYGPEHTLSSARPYSALFFMWFQCVLDT